MENVTTQYVVWIHRRIS